MKTWHEEMTCGTCKPAAKQNKLEIKVAATSTPQTGGATVERRTHSSALSRNGSINGQMPNVVQIDY